MEMSHETLPRDRAIPRSGGGVSQVPLQLLSGLRIFKPVKTKSQNHFRPRPCEAAEFGEQRQVADRGLHGRQGTLRRW